MNKYGVFIITVLSIGFAASAVLAAPLQWSISQGGNDHYYEYFSKDLTWEEAQADLVSHNGYLATTNIQGEREWIISNISNAGFLGGYKRPPFTNDRDFVWVTEETDFDTFWAANEPNGGEPEKYMLLKYGLMFDSADTGTDNLSTQGFIAEYPAYPCNNPVPEPATLALLGIGSALQTLKRKKLL